MAHLIPTDLRALATSARRSPPKRDDYTARVLEAELRASVRGEVRFDDGSRALYATDASNYRQVPVGVVIPRDTEDVERTVALCAQRGVPVLSRGGGTSLAGQCCNAAVVLDMSKYLHEVIEVDPGRRLARVQPGVVLDSLREAAERYHLTFGPDPATHNRCTIGGMIGNNSCGAHSVMAGKTEENVESLDVLTYDGLRLQVGATSEAELAAIIAAGGRRGEIYGRLRDLRDRYAPLIRARYPEIPRRVSGFNLPQLLPENGFNVARALVGTEGTCVTVLEATLKLVTSPPARALAVLGFDDVFQACDAVPAILAHNPIALEGFDSVLLQDLRAEGKHLRNIQMLPGGNGLLLVEFGADEPDEAAAHAANLVHTLKQSSHAPDTRIYRNRRDQQMIWTVRESGLGGTARVPGQRETWPGWEDSAVPPERMADYLRQLRKLVDEYHYHSAFYGHFGQGCLHTRIDFDLASAEGIRNFRGFMERAADLCLEFGGSLSGEHGDGQARAELLPKMFGPELVEAFREFKQIWDPQWKMNPGKVVDPYRIDQNLRLGTDYAPATPQTHFQFPRDGGDFGQAVLRCVGVGLCRRQDSGTMCPSYMVTREEADSTRGRARLLFEMMRGDAISDGWHSEAVRESLDLCLACKGCKHDCPVSVDMATYKSEFLSHYYAGRLRPRAAYSMGLIYWWARLASHAPRLVNAVARAPLMSTLMKRVGGISPQRTLPAFANVPFKRWFAAREPRNPDGPPVLLWADTFNNYFHPEVAIAATEVLEAAGFRVVVPSASLCCGRPLYDWGMLNLAERQLRQILEVLRPQIRAGVSVVGLEPSCISVFRDELVNLFPHDADAQRLSRQSYMLGEFLDQRLSDEQRRALPKLKRQAVVHGHCHHKSVLSMNGERRLFDELGLDYQVLDDGCCGMAGAFGFEPEHYDVSVAAGERVLLPAVRATSDETLIVTDGFSCREQIAQTTGRETLHTAQILHLALAQAGLPVATPEAVPSPTTNPGAWRRRAVAGGVAAVAVAAGLAGVRRGVRKRAGPGR